MKGLETGFMTVVFMMIYNHVYTEKFEYSSFGNNNPTSRLNCDKLAPSHVTSNLGSVQQDTYSYYYYYYYYYLLNNMGVKMFH